MNAFARLIPYVLNYRRQVFASIAVALVVALFWALTLTLAFPVVKVLLEGQTLGEYVESEIGLARSQVEKESTKLERLDESLAALKQQGLSGASEKYVRVLKDQSRHQSSLSRASWKLSTMSWLKQSVVPRLPRDQFDTLALILAALLLMTVAKGACIFVQETLIGSVVELTVMEIRKTLFRRSLKLDYQTLALNGTSELMSRFTYDMTLMSSGLALLGGKVVREPLKACACIAVAFYVNWQLTLLSLLAVPIALVVFQRIGKRLKQASHRLMESMSRIYKVLEESFDASKVVIAFEGGRRQRQRFHRENKNNYSKAMKIVRIDALTSPTSELLGMLAVTVALLPGAYLVLRDETSIWGIRLASYRMDIADLSLLYTILAGVIDPVRKLSSVYSKLKRSGAAAERVFALMDRQSLVKEAAKPCALPRHASSIVFDRIDFSYARGDEQKERPAALSDVSLKVNFGETVAVVGENGSGKSTLVNLLPRLYDPNRGAVLIDGVDVRDVRLRDLRGQIGVVTQETLLFDDTILENIRFGAPSASLEQIRDAARKAHVTQFIEQLPDGFNTRVGEKGGRLSGGQRQRVALARAILRDPSILILDEATSAIDAQSEFLIHQTLRSFVENRTAFIITHSVSRSILDFVTTFAVMDQGRLVGVGAHEALLETCPLYQRLLQAQVQQRSA